MSGPPRCGRWWSILSGGRGGKVIVVTSWKIPVPAHSVKPVKPVVHVLSYLMCQV